MEIGTNIEWNDNLEVLLKAEAEKALCSRWAHLQAHRSCASSNTRLSLPIIILGTLSGSVSLGGENLLPWSGAPAAIGFLTLVVSMLNVIQNHFGFSRRAEGHRVAALSYGRLHKFLTIELNLPRSQRMVAGALLKWLREEIDRLAETAPVLPLSAIQSFKQAHSAATLSKPDDLNGLDPVLVLAHAEVISHPSVRIDVPAPTNRNNPKITRVDI
jgi:hypothetical protein